MQQKALFIAIISALNLLADSQILLSHQPVHVLTPYHPIAVVHPDHVPSYAFGIQNQTSNKPAPAPASSTNKTPVKLSPQETAQKRHLLMTQFTLLLNKLMYAFNPAERKIYLDQIHLVVTELQNLDTRFMEPKADEKIVVVVVPRNVFEDWTNIKKQPQKKPNIQIVNPYQQTHPLDLNTLALLAQQQMQTSFIPPAPVVSVGNSQPDDVKSNTQKTDSSSNLLAQPTVFTTAFQQPTVVAGPVGQQAKIIYPFGSTGYIPGYGAVQQVGINPFQYNPYYANYLVPGSHGIIHAPSYNGGMTLVHNPLFAKSLAGLKK